MSNWRMSKGLVKSLIKCDKCHGHFPKEEFCENEDICLYCAFPETNAGFYAPFNHDNGFPRNETRERYILDNLDNIPEKQSEQAQKKHEDSENRKLYK